MIEDVDIEKICFHMRAFDRVTNVQKAYPVILNCFSKIIICKGIEHVDFLTINQIFREAPLELLKTLTIVVSFCNTDFLFDVNLIDGSF